VLHVDGKLDSPAAPITIAGGKVWDRAAGRKFDIHIANTGRLDFSDEPAIIVGTTLLALAAGAPFSFTPILIGRHFSFDVTTLFEVPVKTSEKIR